MSGMVAWEVMVDSEGYDFIGYPSDIGNVDLDVYEKIEEEGRSS